MGAIVIDRAVRTMVTVEAVALTVTVSLVALTVSGVVPHAWIGELIVLDLLWITAAAVSVSFRRNGIPVVEGWTATLRRTIPRLPRRLLRHEFALMKAIVRVALRRGPDIPADAVPLAPARGGTGILIAFGVALAIELALVEVLVPWPTVRLVLHLSSAIAVIYVAGFLAVRRQYPHSIEAGELVIRSGFRVAARISRSTIIRSTMVTDASTLSPEVRSGIARYPGPNGCTHAVALRSDTEVLMPGVLRDRHDVVHEIRFATGERDLHELLTRA